METNHAVIPNVTKIAVLRSLVLGDLIFALPALDALHRTYPEAEVTYIGRQWHAGFLPGRVPGVKHVAVIKPSSVDYEDLGFLIEPAEALAFFERMKAEQFDLAVQMQGGGYSSNPFVRRIGARLAIGGREDKAIALDRWVPYHYHQQEVIRQLEIVALAGAKTTEMNPCLAVLDRDLQAAEPFLAEIGGPFVVLHSGARDIRRCWRPEFFAQLGDLIRRELGLRVVLTGSGEVADDTAHLVESAMQEKAVNLAGRLSLEGLVGVLSRAEFMVSNDTGPMHLALALGTRTLGLFWVEYIIKSMPLQRDIFRPFIAWDRHCPLCGKYMDYYEVTSCDPRDCMHEVSFLDSIQVGEVFAEARQLVGVS